MMLLFYCFPQLLTVLQIVPPALHQTAAREVSNQLVNTVNPLETYKSDISFMETKIRAEARKNIGVFFFLK